VTARLTAMAAADGAAPPSPARLDGGGAMAAAADVSQVQA